MTRPASRGFVVHEQGVVHLDGVEHAVRAGTSVFIPGGVWHGARNTGPGDLRLLYVFAADAFADVRYEFDPHPAPESPRAAR